jgi:hypothetical protein
MLNPMCSEQSPALIGEGRVYSVKSFVIKKISFYGIYPFLADAAAVSAIASGSQHKTMSAIRHRIGLIPCDPDG